MAQRRILHATGVSLLLLCAASVAWTLGARHARPNDRERPAIVFFAGGSEGGLFPAKLARGAVMAGEDLGADVRVVWSDWDIDAMARQLKQEIEREPAAICVMGHPGVDRLGPLMDEALRRGIHITLLNVDLPAFREAHVLDGVGYTGQDLERSGRLLAQGLIRKHDLRPGQRAVVFHSYEAQASTRGVRGLGAAEAFEVAGLLVTNVYTPYAHAMDATTPEARAFLLEALGAEGAPAVVVNDGVIDNGPIVEALAAQGKQPGEVAVGVFDLSPSSIEHLRSGWIQLVHDQQPLLQGYYAVLQATMTERFHVSGLYVDTGLGLIDAAMLPQVEPMFEAGYR